MSCLVKIKESLNWDNENYKSLARYILENHEEVINLSVQELSDLSNTSCASIVRYAKRLGYEGYAELKLELAKDDSDQLELINAVIDESDNPYTLVKKAYINNMSALEKAYRLVNPMVVQDAVKAIDQANTIYVVGLGGSSIAAQDLMQKFNRIGKNIKYYGDYHLLISSLTCMQENDVLVAISYSGSTKEVLYAAKLAKQHGGKIVAITQYRQNTLSKLSDYVLYVPIEEKHIRVGAISSRIASLAITDLLFLGCYKNNFDKNTQAIKLTHESINVFENNG